jgi:hypothetical protein
MIVVIGMRARLGMRYREMLSRDERRQDRCKRTWQSAKGVLAWTHWLPSGSTGQYQP